MTAEGEDECIPGTMYWGCESKFHKLCCEADQRPSKRPWSSVIEYIVSSPEEAAKFGVEREGSNKLTPLAIVSEQAPTEIVKAILDVAPEAALIRDKYGNLPIHRAALQNRLAHAEEVMRLLRDADPSTLVIKNGLKRTPLMCALESGRGVAAPVVVEVLLGDGQAGSMENKKGKTPLDIATQRKDKVNEGDRQVIIDRLSAFAVVH